VVWKSRPQVAGWTVDAALLVIAWFTLLKSLLEGAVNPSLQTVIEHIRTGTLDFVLLKPADSQFLVSFAKFQPQRIADTLGAFLLCCIAFSRMGRVPAGADVGMALLLTIASAALLYSLCILVISAAFWVVRLDNLIYLFNSIFDAARWPSTVFRGAWRVLFTFVIPLALMTTFPARALLGQLEGRTALLALGGAFLFVSLSRLIWLRAISRYTSASS
jgi:ABC-2 type transport system permease protein